ncbi:MAG: SulP family inorganic anion transporter [Alkaliphilus sp.]|nr:SulP family inorganic anion transporter [Alkaliphilus sp.]
MKFFDLTNLRGDLFGGITAGVVALPLALAFGEASGAGPIAGLWGAIFLGFFAALFGGTGAQISGPTGPMVVVFAGLFARLDGDLELVFTAVIIAGIIQILMGVFKFGDYINLVPYPVVSGFMSGIGCIIISLQLSRLFGHEPGAGGTIPSLLAIPGAVANPIFPSLLVGLIALGIVFFWPKAWVKWFPGPLAALIIGTVTSIFIPGAALLGDIPTGLPRIQSLTISAEMFIIVIEVSVILAVLASIDSLLTSLVADNMTRTRHNSNKELIGQGIGNTLAGIFGGVPGAGATMRTVVNIQNGGRTKLAGMIHSLVLLVIVLLLGPLAGKIPHSVLAGILIKVGYDIIDRYFLRRVSHSPRWDFFLMLLVLGLTVFVDLITAVIIGALLAAIYFVKKMANYQLLHLGSNGFNHSDPKVNALLEASGLRISILEFKGPLSFAVTADLEHQMRERSKSDIDYIIIDFSGLWRIDLSAARSIDTIILDALESGKTIYLAGMTPKIKKIIRAFCEDKCASDHMCFDTPLEALESIITSKN